MSFLIGKDMIGGYGGAMILNGCTIGVEKGEIAVIVGPNGAGKSTAMKAIFGMLSLHQGGVFMDGVEITELKPQDRVMLGMGFVPQTANIFTEMTVEENLEMGAFIRRDDYSDTMEQVYSLFPILKEKRRQPAGELSGGQRQRVALARAFYHGRSVLVMDEATSALDNETEQEIVKEIQHFKGKKTMIVIAHRLTTVRHCDRIYRLKKGRIVEAGTPEKVMKKVD